MVPYENLFQLIWLGIDGDMAKYMLRFENLSV